MDNPTLAWWAGLCSVSALNVLGWLAAATLVQRRRAVLPTQAWRTARLQLMLSAGYVFGCTYRSAFPVYDVQRLCLVDSWMSSVIVGRSVATLAELCFVMQWALLLRRVAQTTGSTAGLAVSRVLVPLIVVAELCSWHAVLTTANLGHVLEESIWGLCAAMLAASLITVWPRCTRQARQLLAVCSAAAVAYVLYMFAVDVPMYWARWLADEAQGRTYFSVGQGLKDASARWVVSHRWEDWKGEVVWMSLYFSVAVWFSIALVHGSLTALVRTPGIRSVRLARSRAKATWSR